MVSSAYPLAWGRGGAGPGVVKGGPVEAEGRGLAGTRGRERPRAWAGPEVMRGGA